MFSDLTCTSGQTYVKFYKVCGSSYASEESFEIYDGSTLLYTGDDFANNEERTIEQCLTSSTNNQYTLKLIDSYGDSWYNGAYLAVYGQYGNVVFKNFMTDDDEETYQISLYYGVSENTTWVMTTGSASTGWTDYSFEDSSWSEVTLGSVSTSVSAGTQYFRKQFSGIASMAAYDVRLYYKAGVVAYVNGAEVYRDNMPAGDVTSTTAATGEYDELAYHGFIRPGTEVSSSQSILAVELHFVTDQTTVDFNAYLAILAPSVLDTTCFIYGESATITSSSSSSTPSNAFDFKRTSSFYISSSYLPNTLTYTFEGPTPYINTIRVWPYSSTTTAPSTFTFEGSDDGQSWTTIISVEGVTYESKVYQTFEGYFYPSLYSNYHAYIESSSTTYVYVYEMQPLICSLAVPTSITFTPNTYTFYAYYEEVSIKRIYQT